MDNQIYKWKFSWWNQDCFADLFGPGCNREAPLTLTDWPSLSSRGSQRYRCGPLCWHAEGWSQQPCVAGASVITVPLELCSRNHISLQRIHVSFMWNKTWPQTDAFAKASRVRRCESLAMQKWHRNWQEDVKPVLTQAWKIREDHNVTAWNPCSPVKVLEIIFLTFYFFEAVGKLAVQLGRERVVI